MPEKFTLTPFLPFLLALSMGAAAAAERPDSHYQRALQVQHTASLAELFTLYARSAEGGYAPAQYNVAMMYANGESVNVDYQQAAYWFGRSAAQGFAPAQYRLGEMYYFGRGGLIKDLKKALQLFESASDQGDPDAQVNLAVLLGSGEGVALDTGRALELLAQARQAGHELAAPYRGLLAAAPDTGFTPEQQAAYWDRQRLFWIEEAATYGVREAEEAVGAPLPGAE